jgi:hypothetical protein
MTTAVIIMLYLHLTHQKFTYATTGQLFKKKVGNRTILFASFDKNLKIQEDKKRVKKKEKNGG